MRNGGELQWALQLFLGGNWFEFHVPVIERPRFELEDWRIPGRVLNRCDLVISKRSSGVPQTRRNWSQDPVHRREQNRPPDHYI